MRELSVAVVQMQPILCEVGANLAHITELVDKICLQQPVNLIVFPELATTGYECGVRFTDLAEKVPGHTANLMAQKAAEFGVYIAFGMPVKERVESILYNAAVMVGPDGQLVDNYRKVHVRGEEHLAFRPGYRFPILDIGLGTVGLLLGWDLAFPEAARSLALDGAELVCLCANWEQPQAEEWHALLKARAFENSVFIAAANRIGQEPSYTFLGRSIILGPRGETLAYIDQAVEGCALARLDLDEVRRVREEYQLFQLRQPATYRSLVRKY
jgi:predicted amidohydrolase